ncbi:MAG: hypothetical protein EZS28_027815, partial [Streblomastix strix]
VPFNWLIQLQNRFSQKALFGFKQALGGSKQKKKANLGNLNNLLVQNSTSISFVVANGGFYDSLVTFLSKENTDSLPDPMLWIHGTQTNLFSPQIKVPDAFIPSEIVYGEPTHSSAGVTVILSALAPFIHPATYVPNSYLAHRILSENSSCSSFAGVVTATSQMWDFQIPAQFPLVSKDMQDPYMEMCVAADKEIPFVIVLKKVNKRKKEREKEKEREKDLDRMNQKEKEKQQEKQQDRERDKSFVDGVNMEKDDTIENEMQRKRSNSINKALLEMPPFTQTLKSKIQCNSEIFAIPEALTLLGQREGRKYLNDLQEQKMKDFNQSFNDINGIQSVNKAKTGFSRDNQSGKNSNDSEISSDYEFADNKISNSRSRSRSPYQQAQQQKYYKNKKQNQHEQMNQEQKKNKNKKEDDPQKLQQEVQKSWWQKHKDKKDGATERHRKQKRSSYVKEDYDDEFSQEDDDKEENGSIVDDQNNNNQATPRKKGQNNQDINIGVITSASAAASASGGRVLRRNFAVTQAMSAGISGTINASIQPYRSNSQSKDSKNQQELEEFAIYGKVVCANGGKTVVTWGALPVNTQAFHLFSLNSFERTPMFPNQIAGFWRSFIPQQYLGTVTSLPPINIDMRNKEKEKNKGRMKGKINKENEQQEGMLQLPTAHDPLIRPDTPNANIPINQQQGIVQSPKKDVWQQQQSPRINRSTFEYQQIQPISDMHTIRHTIFPSSNYVDPFYPISASFTLPVLIHVDDLVHSVNTDPISNADLNWQQFSVTTFADDEIQNMNPFIYWYISIGCVRSYLL